MIDWAARIDELADKLAREYGMPDRPALDVILSALVDCPGTPAVWLILETNWYSRYCLDAWFAFGETWIPQSLPRLRARSPWRQIEEEIQQWLDAPSDPHLFIESDYDRYPYFNRLTQGHFLLHRSLRIRTRTARSGDPLRSLDTRTMDRRKDELAAAADLALADRVRSRAENPPAFRQPTNFLYHLETLQRLAPWYPDWDLFTRSFAALAVRHAHLYNRRETGPEDIRVMARVAADSVPLWITKALRILAAGPAQTRTIEVAMCLEDKTRRSGHGAHSELVRLRRKGAIRFEGKKMHWKLTDEHRDAIVAILEGRAFF